MGHLLRGHEFLEVTLVGVEHDLQSLWIPLEVACTFLVMRAQRIQGWESAMCLGVQEV